MGWEEVKEARGGAGKCSAPPQLPSLRGRTWQEQVALWREFGFSFCDTGCSSRASARGGHKVGKATVQERQIFWLHHGGDLSPFPCSPSPVLVPVV